MRAVPTHRYLVFFSIATIGCLVDLATKRWAFDRLGILGGRIEWIWNGVFGLQTSLNEGALFGFGQGQVLLFVVLSCVALVALLIWLFVFDAARDLLLCVALGCVTAGILGNLYDRVGLPGLRWPCVTTLHEMNEPVHAVRDWILVMIGPWHWPNFNIADSLLVCGAALLLWHAFRSGGKEVEAPEESNSGTKPEP